MNLADAVRLMKSRDHASLTVWYDNEYHSATLIEVRADENTIKVCLTPRHLPDTEVIELPQEVVVPLNCAHEGTPDEVDISVPVDLQVELPLEEEDMDPLPEWDLDPDNV